MPHGVLESRSFLSFVGVIFGGVLLVFAVSIRGSDQATLGIDISHVRASTCT